ncbi:hypothetical protein KP509_29G013700 [Ceratopteris richardii]|uniref:Uncharacterized protein n=1 Tax=Ceratopteris richardii TaxID=49495 RepID=A0A8T2R6L0_CERRI|nr:hypothetical protein KP509_29G013700 [Ceratopteris richardii]
MRKKKEDPMSCPVLSKLFSAVMYFSTKVAFNTCISFLEWCARSHKLYKGQTIMDASMRISRTQSGAHHFFTETEGDLCLSLCLSPSSELRWWWLQIQSRIV